MIMSNRYLSAISHSTAPISESGRISATAGTCSPRSRPLAVQAATRTCLLWRMRLTLPVAASVSTRSLPSRSTNHTGVATPWPSRL
jgi:hypothetical protein